MSHLTIVKKPTPIVTVENLTLWEYEVVETGEKFVSLTQDISLAFAGFVNGRQEEDNMLASIEESHLLEQFEASDKGRESNTSKGEDEIEKELLKAYAVVLAKDVRQLVCKYCEACEIFDPSQEHHDCLMLEKDVSVYRYLEEALKNVDEDDVMHIFQENVKNLSVLVSEHELSNYNNKDTRRSILLEKKEILEDLVIENM